MAPPPLPLTEIPTLTLLYKLRHLSLSSPSPTSTKPLPPPNPAYNNLISLIRHDITALHVSAIVNAANSSLLGGGGVDGAIHARAGPKLLDECETLDGCPTGSAKITGGYELPAEKVIHAVGPVYWRAKNEREGLERELLSGCYKKCLELAVENGCTSIAFSCLSAGVYGYPSREAAAVALQTVREWVEGMEREGKGTGGLERIVFCCFERKDEVAYQDLIPKFFPPVQNETSQSAAETDESDKLASSLPDPPGGELKETDGQPNSKKQKLSASADEEWENIEKPEGSSQNGVDVSPEVIESENQKEVVDGEKKEEIAAALHTAEMGGNPPQSMLEKDW